MVKVCAVPGCQSGRRKDRRERQGLGLRQISLFSIPKCNNRRSQWNKAHGFELKANQNVCQYHFAEESIHKCDKIILTDGTIYEAPLVPWRLTQDAVPISRNNDPMDCENNNVVKEEPPRTTPIIINPAMETALSVHNAVEEGPPRNSPIILEPAIETVPSVPPEPWMGEILSNVERAVTAFTMGLLKDELNVGLLPESWAWTQKSSGVVFTLVGQSNFQPQLHLEVDLNLSLQIRTSTDKVILLNDQVESMEDIRQYLKILNKVDICSGTGIESESRHSHCMGILDDNETCNFRRRNLRCMLCQRLRRALKKREERRTKLARKRNRKLRKADLARKKFVRLKRKNEKLRSDVADLRRECLRIERETLEKSISTLPETQKQAVRTCFEAAKLKNSKGRRYPIDWIYECLLMRIKNSGLYDHIRDRKILPLPCRETLNRYIQKISSSAYGFQTAIFECMKTKGSQMKSSEKRGSLLVDEMKLSESISFNKQTLEFNGFVDLGQYTPEGKKNTRADHALVFMFQPFQGRWVQVLGCFLTKDSVTSAILHKLILDCIILLSNSGFHVDVVTTDGAQWNRAVWSIFGIEDGRFSCEHPCNHNKRLWMISDFPHLAKCFRNGLIRRRFIETPDGTVENNHWEALIKYEQFMKPNMCIAYRLTPAHLNPVGYQKMNVPLAFQLFSLPVRVAMEIYRNKPECPELVDSQPTQKLCERMDNLITAMMSRTPQNALRGSENCPRKKHLAGQLLHFTDC